MRKPVRRSSPPTATPSVTAPVGGLNSRDALDAMPPTDAIDLVNWTCETDSVRTRDGFASHATGMPSGPVETLATWLGPSSQVMLAGRGGEIYNASSAGAATVLTSAVYASDQWQTLNFKGRLFAFNGTDAPWDYDGTTVADTAWSGSGLTITDLIQGTVFKARIYAVEKNSASFWYAASGAITSTMTEFDLSTIAQRGGFLQAVGTWSRDGGAGLEDLFVAVMSTGEIIVYQGINPATDFVKVGSFFAAEPIGRRCITKIGGDLALITKAGILPISLIMQGWEVANIFRTTAWGKIAPTIRDAAASVASRFGWDAGEITPDGKVYFNVPNATAGQYDQYVLNTFNDGWSKFTGINASSWTIYDGVQYFGGQDGVVYKHTGADDAGVAISYSAKQAFTYLGSRGIKKQCTAVMPVVSVGGTLTTTLGVDVDFSDRTFPVSSVSLAGNPSGSAWNEDEWNVAEWAASSEILTRWVSVAGIGRNFSVRFEGSTSQPVTWYSTNFMVRGGGML